MFEKLDLHWRCVTRYNLQNVVSLGKKVLPMTFKGMSMVLSIATLLLLLTGCSTKSPGAKAQEDPSLERVVTSATIVTPIAIYDLTSPWDTRIFNDDDALSKGQCPNPLGLPTQIPDRLENGGVDEKAWDELSNIFDIVTLSDLAVSKGSKAAAACVLDNLLYWAQNNAFIVNKECETESGAHWIHGYDRANFINGVLAIPYLQIRNAHTLDESKKTAVLSWFEKLYLCSRTRAEGMLLHAQENGLGPHNQTYPALLAVATTSIVLDKTDEFEWAIEKYKQSIATISEDGTSPNEIAHKMGWTLHYHTLIENFSVHLLLLGEMNGFEELFKDPALLRITKQVLDSYEDPIYLKELTGYEQTQDPLTTPWNLSWVEHMKRYNADSRLGELAEKFRWKMDHQHTGGHPEYWWPEYWE